MGKLVNQMATENNVSAETVENNIEKIITSAMESLGNDDFTLWKTVFGKKRPSVEEFLRKMDDLVIKN